MDGGADGPAAPHRCIGLHPAKHGRVVARDPAIRQQLGEIAVADRKPRYHRSARRIISAVKCRPLNASPLPIVTTPPTVLVPPATPTIPVPGFATELLNILKLFRINVASRNPARAVLYCIVHPGLGSVMKPLRLVS